jgi:hypothetical protein
MIDVMRILNAFQHGAPNTATELLELGYEQLRHLPARKTAERSVNSTR